MCEAFGVLFGILNHCLGAHYCDKGLLPMMYMVVVLVDMPDDVQAVRLVACSAIVIEAQMTPP